MKRGILLSYAFISRSIATDNDIFLALVPLFRPIIEQMANTIYDPKRFCQRVDQLYGLSMTTDVANEFIPRFQKLGLLTTQGEHHQRGSYLCVVPEKSEPEKTNEREAARIITDVIDRFRDYTKSFPSLLTIDLDDDALVEMLSDWLVKSDPAVRQAEFALGESQEGLPPSTATDHRKYRRESDYLCARFTEELSKSDPDLFEEMANIATGSLISEVVLDLKVPPSASLKAQDLTIFLDAPFMMDVLELTGIERKENSQYIFNKLKSVGANLQIFAHSLAELTDNLRAVLGRVPYLRNGPTADALRKNELSELYARTILADPRTFVERTGVTVIDEDLATPINEVPYFDSTESRHFSDALTGWHSQVARDRDTKSITYVMRRRKGHRSSDLFRARFALLTHNPMLARVAHRFCVDEGILYREHVGPAVHQRRLAALIWVTLGTDERVKLSKRQLITNCANAVRSRSGVIEGMRATLMQVKPELKDQFDALLTRPRSVQLAMDLTLGVAEVIGPENIEQVFDLVKASAAENEREKFSVELAKAREGLGATLSAKDMELKKVGDALDKASADRNDLITSNRQMYEQWVQQSYQFSKTLLNAAKVSLSIALITATAVTSSIFGASDTMQVLAVIVISVVTIYPLWTRSFVRLARLEEDCERRLCEFKLARLVQGAKQEAINLYADVNWGNPPSVIWIGKYALDNAKHDGRLF